MPVNVKILLERELEEAKRIYNVLEDIELKILMYKDELKSDMEAIELLLKRQNDKKFDQINSALDFIMNDLTKYIDQEKHRNSDIVESDNETTKSKNKPLDNYLLASVIDELLIKNPDRVFKTKQLQDYLLVKFPELTDNWKRPDVSIHGVLKLCENIKKVGTGQYTLKKK